MSLTVTINSISSTDCTVRHHSRRRKASTGRRAGSGRRLRREKPYEQQLHPASTTEPEISVNLKSRLLGCRIVASAAGRAASLSDRRVRYGSCDKIGSTLITASRRPPIAEFRETMKRRHQCTRQAALTDSQITKSPVS